MQEGSVMLVGIGEQSGAPATLTVTNGNFSGPVTPGKKRVEIRAFKKGEPTKMGDMVIEGSPTNYLPPRFNTESTLTAEVGADGLNPSKFDVKSK